MGWEDLLSESSGRLTAPWVGGRKIYSGSKVYRIEGKLPPEFGWYEFDYSGRRATLLGAADPDPDYQGSSKHRTTVGYLVGDRLILDYGLNDLSLDKLFDQTQHVFLVEPGLDRFTRIEAVIDADSRLIYLGEQFPLGPEDAVRRAFIDRKESVRDIKDVVPALDLAFQFATQQRQLLEERRAEIARIREEERRREEAMRSIGTGLGRRTLAVEDFEAAAKAALSVGGAELLDIRPGRIQTEAVVQYRYEHRRLECVADKRTLRIVDSGICLTDHRTHEKGDTYFTLESLPSVVGEAIRDGKLVVYRHVDGDVDDEEYEDW